jgi:hypothetical protein
MQSEYAWQADKIKADLDAIAKAREAKVSITVSNLEEMEKRLSNLAKDETKTITVKTVETKSCGGVAGYAGGGFVRRRGRLPGYSRKDTVPALLTWGERIINAMSTRAWDNYLPGFMDMANRVRSGSDILRLLERFSGGMRRFATGGIVMPKITMPAIPRYAEGGTVSPTFQIRDLGQLTVSASGKTGQIYGNADLLKALKAGIERETLLYGRK